MVTGAKNSKTTSFVSLIGKKPGRELIFKNLRVKFGQIGIGSLHTNRFYLNAVRISPLLTNSMTGIRQPSLCCLPGGAPGMEGCRAADMLLVFLKLLNCK